MPRTNKKDWRNLAITEWTVTTFREYMKDKHTELYGIDYVTNNYAMEGRMLKNLLGQHDNEAVKRFIDACFADYKPNRQYPGLNFAFMYSYQRSRILPRVLDEMRRERERAERVAEQSLSDEDFADFI